MAHRDYEDAPALRRSLAGIVARKEDGVSADAAVVALALSHVAQGLAWVSESIDQVSGELSSETGDGLKEIGKSFDRFTDTLIDIVKFQNKRDDERRAEDAAYLAEREAEADDE